jgi:MFS transporter, DHA1 family, multidrug resistance protein
MLNGTRSTMPYYRRNLYILSTTIFLTCVSWNQVMPFLPKFIQQMGITDKHALSIWLGLVFALQSVASIVTMPFWGKLGDRYGRKPMAVRAGACLALIYFGMSACRTPLQLVVLRFFNGALTGFIPSSMALIATNTPDEHAPKSLATAQVANSSGLIIGPAIGGWLASLVGYRGSMLLSGSLVMLSAIAVAVLVQERNKVPVVEQTSLIQDFATSLRSRVLGSIMFTMMVTGIFGAAIAPILVLHLSGLYKDIPDWASGTVFSLSPLALALTAHKWTRFGERWGFQRCIQIGLIGGAVTAVLLTFMTGVWTFAAAFFVNGIFLAAILPSASALICTRVDQGFRGRAYGMQSSASMIGTVAGPLLGTRIQDMYGTQYVFLVTGVIMLAGSAGFGALVKGWEPVSETATPTSFEPALQPDTGGE